MVQEETNLRGNFHALATRKVGGEEPVRVRLPLLLPQLLLALLAGIACSPGKPLHEIFMILRQNVQHQQQN